MANPFEQKPPENPFAPPSVPNIGLTPNALELAKREQAIKEEEAAAKRLADAEAESAKQHAAHAKPVLTQEQEEHKVKIDTIHKQIQVILKKHNGLESNIGLNNPYWGLQNQLRALNAEVV